ncbi:MAG: hypothetical protein GWN86_06970 [Desulfobacterales bacterium]|nr:hypothetical protein [Desulfobacterales bacterium]
MPSYSIDGQDSSVAADSILYLARGASKRYKIFYLTTGSAATPADQAIEMEVNRVTNTTSAAGSAATPEPFDDVDGASVTTALTALTTEPMTKAETLLHYSHNLRANFQWYANPGKEFTFPDTATTGAVLECVSATAAQNYEATLHFDE